MRYFILKREKSKHNLCFEKQIEIEKYNLNILIDIIDCVIYIYIYILFVLHNFLNIRFASIHISYEKIDWFHIHQFSFFFARPSHFYQLSNWC